MHDGRSTVPVPAMRLGMKAGFSLIELLVTMAVLAIIASMAMPSLLGVVNGNRLTAHANELVTSLQVARMEAIRRNARVTVCRSEDANTCSIATNGNWAGWLVVDNAGTVLRSDRVKPPVQLTAAEASIVFRPDGLARDSSGQLAATSFVVCIPRNEPAQNRRQVNVASGSRVSTAPVTGGGTCP